jgi:glycosyltransferase involved in cell wall biosynthesis/peptidoglycan/xylan/chitin deacetylase (PgdA/CDA1 family)
VEELQSGEVAAGGQAMLVANTGWYLYNFRRGLIRQLRGQGLDVTAVCPRDPYVERLCEEGVRWLEWRIDRASMNPLGNVAAVLSLARIYRRQSPQLVHHFTVKAILYGTLAARLAGVRCIVNSVTGLGHVFLSQKLAARLIRPAIRRWYVWALTTSGVRTLFQNRDDLATLAETAPELIDRAVLTRGSGVDLERFAPRTDQRAEGHGKCVLFAGRLLHEKGIREFVEASRMCRDRGIDARWLVCGSADPGNPSSVDRPTLRRWQTETFVEFLGHIDPLESRLAEADIVVLPSYREGTPRALLEAAAMGKPIVASDVPGCREVVVDGENGLLVPPRDPQALADAVTRLLGDEALRAAMGHAGRQRMVADFDERQVVAQMVRVYDELLRGQRSGRRAAREGTNRPAENRVAQPSSLSRSWEGEAPAEPRSDSVRGSAGAALPVRGSAGASPSRWPTPGIAPGYLEQGVFVISLDFELAWGTRGRPAAKRVGRFLDGTRDAIRGLLDLFERYEIGATWAVVGGLLLGSQGRRERHAWLAGDHFADIPTGDSVTSPHWYAEDVLEWLRHHPVPQEIGCHTLTHQFVDPGPEGREALREDLRRFRQLFDELYLEQPTTFIFPKARMGHLDVLAEEGFRCIRGPESKWFESLPGEWVPAALRLADARLAVRPKVGAPERLPDGLWMIPSSQFYSPFLSVGRYVSVEARVRKALKGLRHAARRKGVYHLWTHPFNLGVRTGELLGGMERILQEAQRLRAEGVLEILTMGDIAARMERAARSS